MRKYRILLNGNKAMTIELGNVVDEQINTQVSEIASYIAEKEILGITDFIPTFRSLTVCYEPQIISAGTVKSVLKKAYKNCGSQVGKKHKVVCIPVCYDVSFGVDLEEVAAYHGLKKEEVVRLHSEKDYLIYMMGFLPGFPYLGGMNPKLNTPRLESPRTRIDPGSVGIGGEQTGIYPMASPGGWRLIGRTPVKLYDTEKENSVPYEVGDYIRFVPVDLAEYKRIEEQVKRGTYEIKME